VRAKSKTRQEVKQPKRFCVRDKKPIAPERVARGSTFCTDDCRNADKRERRAVKAGNDLPALWTAFREAPKAIGQGSRAGAFQYRCDGRTTARRRGPDRQNRGGGHSGMRNMAFQFTTEQIRARSKTVTRRPGWEFLKPGELVQAVDKAMGLRKGERMEKLAVIRIVKTRREPVAAIMEYPDDAALEGYPKLSAREFAARFCALTGSSLSTMVTRIEFEYCD